MDDSVEMKNKKGETESEARARGHKSHPGKDIDFENPDTPPFVREEPQMTVSDTNLVIAPLAEQSGERLPLPPKAVFERELPIVESQKAAQELLTRRWNGLLDELALREPVLKPSLERYYDNPPSWWRKWELYDQAHPYVGLPYQPFVSAYRVFEDWFGTEAQLGSAKVVKYEDGLAVHAGKSGTPGSIKPTPGFTRIGLNFAWIDWASGLAPLIVGEDGWKTEWSREQAVDSVNTLGKAYGTRNGIWVGMDLIHLMAGTKSSEQPPLPDEYREEGYKLFLGWSGGQPDLKFRDMFVSANPSENGVIISNSGGAAGPNYTLMDGKELEEAGIVTSDGESPRKGNVIRYDQRNIFRWVEEGMPYAGSHNIDDYVYNNRPHGVEEEFDIAQPDGSIITETRVQPSFVNPTGTGSGAWLRSDTAIEYPWLALGKRHPDLLPAWFPIRSVVIVPSNQNMAMSPYADPLSSWISERRPPIYDLVDEPHATERVNAMIKLAEANAHRGAVIIGVDFSRWDRFVSPQDHAWETRYLLDSYDKEQEILFATPKHPIQLDPEELDRIRTEVVLDGGTRAHRIPVTVIPKDGRPRINTVPFMKRRFDGHDYIVKIQSAVNSSPIFFGDWAIKGEAKKVPIPGYPDKFITSSGGRRSGDKATSNMNSASHGMNAGTVMAMSQTEEGRREISRRSGVPLDQISEFEILDILVRGDDGLWVMIPMEGWTASQTFEIIARVLGKVANAKKQETSDVPGWSTVGYAATLADTVYSRRFTLPARPPHRSYTAEDTAIPSYLLDGQSHEKLVAETVEAKSRLMTLEGPFGRNAVPGWEKIVAYVSDNDKYGLAYSHLELDDAGYAAFIDREAAIWAKRLKNTGISTASDEELYAQYRDNNIHDFLRARALDFEGKKRPYTIPRRVDAQVLFSLMADASLTPDPFNVDWDWLIKEAEEEKERRLSESQAQLERNRELNEQVVDDISNEPFVIASTGLDTVDGFDTDAPVVTDEIDD